MNKLQLFNTLTRKKEEFIPLEEGNVKMYCCGPTVYNFAHIGNLRSYFFEDILKRVLLFNNYKVNHVVNITDVGHLVSDDDEGEDKMEKAAKREHLDPKLIADKYIAQFEADTARLNILAPTVTARATNYIEEMMKMVQELLDKGFAYATPKAIYFDTAKFTKYNDLNGQVMSENIAGAGFGSQGDPEKKQPADFALWFFKTGAHKNALQFWASPFSSPEVENGEGFPGWHIECSSMIRKELGKTIDIHIGGIEHVAVHHTNEIAQSEAANGVKFVNYWMHNEHLTMNDKKISKSDGNFVLLDELIAKGYDPMHLRYLFLQSHYRSKQNFSEEAMNSARTAYEKLAANLVRWSQDAATGKVSAEYSALFKAALEDDFNIPKALAVVWDLSKSQISDAEKLATVLDFDKVLGLGLQIALEKSKKKSEVDPKIAELVGQREVARKNKDWATADKLRQQLETEFGFKVSDK